MNLKLRIPKNMIRVGGGNQENDLKKECFGVPVVAQWLTNSTRNHEVAGSIPALAQWVKDLTLP